MVDTLEDQAAIETRHRKEKKELQAQIQALKKVAKNDKTKKRELIAEITTLELQLEERHRKELEFVENQCNIVNKEKPLPELNQEISKLKISKAQKRRDKKLKEEKDRQENIKLQEQENRHGPRNVELQLLTAMLKAKNLKIYPIPSDGDCLYKAVSHQLQQSDRPPLTVSELRSNVATYIRNNKNEFLPFMCNPETCEMLDDSEYNSYCDKVESTKTWGGQLEIKALSNCLKCPIHVMQATGPDTIEQGNEFDGKPLIITYHRHMYKLGEHYNSTQPIKEEESDAE